MRVAALLFICFPVAFAGALYAKKCGRRTNTLLAFGRLFGSMRSAAALNGGDLKTCLLHSGAALGKGFTFPDAFLALLQREPPANAWRAALEQCRETFLLRAEEKKILSDFAHAFSEKSLQAFCETCAAYENTCRIWHERCAEKNRSAERSCAAFSVLLAALLFIVLM